MANDFRIPPPLFVRQLRPLELPIHVDHGALDRGFYTIYLEQNTVSQNNDLSVCKANYVIKLDFSKIPLVYYIAALRFVFTEIFFIIKYNSATVQGTENVRIVLTADSLSNPVNLKSVNLNQDGAAQLLNEVEKLSQSNRGLFMDDTLTLTFCSCKPS